jgi:hypothetical protein
MAPMYRSAIGANRLVCSSCGSRAVDMVVTGTERARTVISCAMGAIRRADRPALKRNLPQLRWQSPRLEPSAVPSLYRNPKRFAPIPDAHSIGLDLLHHGGEAEAMFPMEPHQLFGIR